VLKKRDGKRLETSQITFLICLLGITTLEWRRNQSLREKLQCRTPSWKYNNINKNNYNA
jgi:hypothetical protein